MDELIQLREFGEVLDEGDADLPAAVRTRVIDGVVAARGSHPRARTWPGSRSRLVLAGVATAVLLAGGMLISQMGTPAGPTAGTSSDNGAILVLHHAAQVALTRTDPLPAPGQFTFVESIDRYSTAVQQADGTFQSRDRGTQLRQTWMSEDGTQEGLVRFRPASDPSAPVTESPLNVGTRGYLSDLPTNASAMSTYLYTHSQGDNPRDEQAFRTAIDLLLGAFLTPAQQAAMFDAVAKIPGIAVQQNVIDLAGRSGVAIIMADGSGTDSSETAPLECVIFDPSTGAYLGTGGSARLRQAVVDRPGQLPSA